MADAQPQRRGRVAAAFDALLTAASLSPDKVLEEGGNSIAVSRSTLYEWRNGMHLPADLSLLMPVVRVCLPAKDRTQARTSFPTSS